MIQRPVQLLTLAALCAAVCAMPSFAQRPPGFCPPPSGIQLLPPPEARPVSPNDSTAYLECAVEQPAVVRPRDFPEYPALLASANVSGTVRVGATISSAGHLDTTTIVVFRSTHALFTQAVRSAIARWTARPARLGGRPVRQWVVYEFQFISNCRGPPNIPPLARQPAGGRAIEICPLH